MQLRPGAWIIRVDHQKNKMERLSCSETSSESNTAKVLEQKTRELPTKGTNHPTKNYEAVLGPENEGFKLVNLTNALRVSRVRQPESQIFMHKILHALSKSLPACTPGTTCERIFHLAQCETKISDHPVFARFLTSPAHLTSPAQGHERFSALQKHLNCLGKGSKKCRHFHMLVVWRGLPHFHKKGLKMHKIT